VAATKKDTTRDEEEQALADAVEEACREGGATCWCSCRASARSATPRTC
jgi:hypothetical protein